MPTQSKASKNGTSPKPAAKGPAEKSQVRATAERTVDIPVGLVLTVSDRVADLVGPFTDRASAERQLDSYRADLQRRVKRTERRGATARRRATSRARKTRNRVERVARKRQRTVESAVKRNRNELEQRVRQAIDLLPV